MIFDSHAHYDSEQFDADRDELLGSVLPQKGVCGVIQMSADFESLEQTVALCEKYDYIYGAVGIHPECAADLPENWLQKVESLLSHPKIVAVGEIGLDYHWEDACPRARQKEVFVQQLELAAKHGLPVSIHDREAHGDMMDILRKYRPQGVVHCFSGSVELARETVSLGLYIGLGGVVTFKNARHSVEVAAEIPLDRLLTETDAPYMAPVPFRGKRCDSTMIAYDAAKIAEARGITAQEVLRAGCENARRLFRLPHKRRKPLKGSDPMTITYEYGGNLYINMTNQCPNACDFCLRQNSSGSLYADNLWYEGAEPSKEAMLADIRTRDLKKYGEIVFCGYGEPACRWDDMLWLAAEIKAMGPYKLRINTNGLADCITGRSTAVEMRGLIDTVSVSLNAPNAEKYDAVCHSKYGPAAFDAMLRFTAEAVKNVPHVVMTVVSTMPAEDIEACRKICASVGAAFRVRAYISE